MRKAILSALGLAAALFAVPALAADPVTLQLKWVTQAQFAGYLVAEAKGYYDEENLDVTINPGGPDAAPEPIIAAGGADVIVDWMGAALAAREKGVPLVNIAQPFERGGLLMICPKDGPVQTEADFRGKTFGVWFFGNEIPFFAWMNKLGIPTGENAGPEGVTVLKMGYDVEPLKQKQADCIASMTYNEFHQAIQAGFTPDKLVIFNYSEMGNDLLEDGLYVLEDKLADPAFKDKMVRFVRASMKGWEYATDPANVDEVAQIVVDAGGVDLDHQKYMVGEIAKLVGSGVLDEEAYNATAAAVLDQKIITKEPSGAWTHDITTAAGLQ
jgi:NitT/TauT family transport system substrate-binding protein